MVDFQLNYTLQVQDLIEIVDPDTFTITSLNGFSPLTVDFSIEKRSVNGFNTGNFKIYNLPEKIYKRIYKPIIYNENNNNTSKLDSKRITFSVGFNKNVIQIWNGYVSFANTEKRGSDIITTIESTDGLPDTFLIEATTYDNNLTNGQIIEKEITRFNLKFSGTRQLNITTVDKFKQDPNSFYNKTRKTYTTKNGLLETIKDIIGYEAYVIMQDKDKIFITDRSTPFYEVGKTIDITDKLLITPISNNTYIKASFLLIPDLSILDKVNFTSVIDSPLSSSDLVVNTIKHMGTIGIKNTNANTVVELITNGFK